MIPRYTKFYEINEVRLEVLSGHSSPSKLRLLLFQLKSLPFTERVLILHCSPTDLGIVSSKSEGPNEGGFLENRHTHLHLLCGFLTSSSVVNGYYLFVASSDSVILILSPFKIPLIRKNSLSILHRTGNCNIGLF